MTVLYGKDKGLEEIRDGKWVEVPIKQGQLHVTIGEVYAMWSNGLFVNNIHRVSKVAKDDRVSFAYFFSQGKHSGKGIDPVCASDEVARFPRVSTASHLEEYIQALTGSK